MNHSLAPPAPTFRKKVVDYDIFTKVYTGNISTFTSGNYIIVFCRIQYQHGFLEVLDYEQNKVIWKFMDERLTSIENIIDLKNGNLLITVRHSQFFINYLTKKWIEMDHFSHINTTIPKELHYISYDSESFNLHDSQANLIKSTKFPSKLKIEMDDPIVFISETKYIVSREGHRILVVDNDNVLYNSNISSYGMMRPKVFNENEYCIVLSSQGFWFFKNDKPKYFPYTGLIMVQKIDENIFLLASLKNKLEIVDLSMNKLKSLKKLQMNEFGSPSAFYFLDNQNLVSCYGKTLKVWSTSHFVNLGIFQFHFPFIYKVKFKDLNFIYE
eukprot:gene7199-11515_t